MFYYISGTLAFCGGDFAVVDAGGVGYKIRTSLYSLSHLKSAGEEVKMYTYTHVREDAFEIYGFLTEEELRMFEMLLGVSGVGPKAALAVLSTLDPAALSCAIVSGDTKAITRAQGVGPKAAQRIIIDLKDKISNDDILPARTQDSFSAAAPSSEAVEALLVLGYSLSDAKEALLGVDTNRDLELIIKDALKKLAR